MAETLESQFTNPRSPIEREIAELNPWFHNLHLPGGVRTAPNHPLGDFPAANWKLIAPHLSDDLTGMTALDIGCNAGFYSFELAKRGAQVTAIDTGEHYLRQARWAARRIDLDGRVTFRFQGLYDLMQSDERFDIVVFLGVFYHLRYPLLGLDIAASRANRYLLFQTMTLPGGDDICDTPADLDFADRGALSDPAWPRMAFIEKRLAGDPTNWWVPNPACVEALLRSSGLTLKKICREFYLCTPGRQPERPLPMMPKEHQGGT